MKQMGLFDICRNRHRGNAESEAANTRLENSGAKSKQRARVLAAIQNAGVRGITCKELARKWGLDMNCISGRFSELKKDDLIIQAGRREGCAVHFTKCHENNL
jgi:hypothetical protein